MATNHRACAASATIAAIVAGTKSSTPATSRNEETAPAANNTTTTAMPGIARRESDTARCRRMNTPATHRLDSPPSRSLAGPKIFGPGLEISVPYIIPSAAAVATPITPAARAR
ncbi:hypothetical protein BLJ79_13675 [Arthrobacter sp. UCD-GKA]|nr:hypothetical protein BLJ79_13675 [Arthrobacter sp. UCD-GKA]